MSKPTVISLFAGAGGLDYGFEAAGFETRAALEIDSDCCKSLLASRDWPVLCKDIHQTSTSELLGIAQLKPGEVDALIGGPPCQPFSKSAYWARGDTKRLKDSRASTLGAFLRCVEEMLPRTFLLENVHGISYTGKEEGLRLLQRATKSINRRQGTDYRPFWKVVNMAHHGVPQLRKRFFLVAQREGKRFSFPPGTHGDNSNGSAPPLLQPLVSAWDAIGELDTPVEGLAPRGRWADLLPSIPEGQNYLWHTSRGGGLPLFGWRTRYWSFLLKLAKSRPSWTIQAQPGPAVGPFHWESRRLSVEEMCRLQTFPEDVRLFGGRASMQRQVGNAVPSLMSEILARGIAEQLLGATISGPLKLAVRPRRPIPSSETVRPVPSRYLSFVGNHPDHPGEGKGASYTSRPRKRLRTS